MNGRISEQAPRALEATPANGTAPGSEPSRNGAAQPAAIAVAGFPNSRYGPLGVFAKRLIARILKPWLVRQQVIDDEQRSAIAELKARFVGWDVAAAERAKLMEGEVFALRRDLSAAAFDFGRIADRILAFENVRRVVDRSAAFRRDVRAQRRDIIEIRQQYAALSARLTMVQREIPPIRVASGELRDALEVAARVESAARQADILGAIHAEATVRNAALDDAVRAESTTRRAEIDAAVRAESEARQAEIDDAVRAESTSRQAEIDGVVRAETVARHADIERAANVLRALLEKTDFKLRDDFASSLAQFGSVVDVVERLRARLLATPYMAMPLDDWQPSRRSAAGDLDYLGFEEVFRGPEELVRERLRAYLPLIAPHVPVVELGCGRGEFLDLLREHGIAAVGVDINAEAVARCRAQGLDGVVETDANAYLASLPQRSVGAVFSAQVAEHLTFDDLLRNVTTAHAVLKPGGLYIAETINPNSIEGGKTFYVDPSHVKPLFPEVFAWLCRSAGFAQARVFYPNGGGFDENDPTSQHEYAVVATA